MLTWHLPPTAGLPSRAAGLGLPEGMHLVVWGHSGWRLPEKKDMRPGRSRPLTRLLLRGRSTSIFLQSWRGRLGVRRQRWCLWLICRQGTQKCAMWSRRPVSLAAPWGRPDGRRWRSWAGNWSRRQRLCAAFTGLPVR